MYKHFRHSVAGPFYLTNCKMKSRRKFVLSVLAALLLVFPVVLTAYAWFYNEKILQLKLAPDDVLDVVISLKVDGGAWRDYEGSKLNCEFDDMLPGAAQSRTLAIRLKNDGKKNFMFSMFFDELQSGDETPLIVPGGEGDTYYYLGSQICITDIAATVDNVSSQISAEAVGKDKFLVETSSEGVAAGQVTGTDEEATGITGFDIIENMFIENGTTVVLTLTFTFVDNGENQNIYQSSGENGYKCRRTLVMDFTQTAVNA